MAAGAAGPRRPAGTAGEAAARRMGGATRACRAAARRGLECPAAGAGRAGAARMGGAGAAARGPDAIGVGPGPGAATGAGAAAGGRARRRSATRPVGRGGAAVTAGMAAAATATAVWLGRAQAEHPPAGRAPRPAARRRHCRPGGGAAAGRPGGAAERRPGTGAAVGGRTGRHRPAAHSPGRRRPPAQRARPGHPRARQGRLPRRHRPPPDGLLPVPEPPVRQPRHGPVPGLQLPAGRPAGRPRLADPAPSLRDHAHLPARDRGPLPLQGPRRQPGAVALLLHLRADADRLAHRRAGRGQAGRRRRRRDLGQRAAADRRHPAHPGGVPPWQPAPGRAHVAGGGACLRPDRRLLVRSLGAPGGDPGPARPERGATARRRDQPVQGGGGGVVVDRGGPGRARARQPGGGQHLQHRQLRQPQPAGGHHPRDDPRGHPDARQRRAPLPGGGLRRLHRPAADRPAPLGDPARAGQEGRPGPLRRPAPLRRQLPCQHRRRRGLRRGLLVLPLGRHHLRQPTAAGALPRPRRQPEAQPRAAGRPLPAGPRHAAAHRGGPLGGLGAAPVVIRVPRPPAPDPREAFSEDEIRACAAYAKPRQRWGLAVLAVRPPGRRAVASLAGLAGDAVPVRAALTLAVVVAAEALVLLPFGLRAWRQDVRAGLSTQALGGFLGDWAKAMAIGLVLTVVPLGALILAARGRPPGYPLSAALVAVVLVVALSLLGPVVFEPLFNRFVSLPAGQLRSRVLEMAVGMGVPVRDVLVADASRRTTKVNAYVSGLGRTRRVVVYDTLAQRAAEDEVLLVLAHELAHVRHRDVTVGTAGAAVASGAAVLAADRLLGVPAVAETLGVSGLGDPRAGAGLLFLAALAGVLASPVASLVSRWSEARADWTALEVARDPESAVALERRLALDNRADLRPNRLLVALFWSHPPTMARIAQARLWATATAGGQEGVVGH